MNVFITGVSSGIGHALAAEYLRRGAKVYGVSRRRPDDLCEHEAFEFRSVDLNDHGATRGVLGELLGGLDRLDVVVLNAGVLSQAGDMRETDLAHLKDVTDINLWANKTVLDVVLQDRAVERRDRGVRPFPEPLRARAGCATHAGCPATGIPPSRLLPRR